MAARLHEMELPRKVLVGTGILGEIVRICEEFGFESALLLSGPHTYQIAGKRVASSLAEADFEVRVRTIEEATIKSVRKIRRALRSLGPHSVAIGVGGGKVIDVTKLSSALEGIPFISVPTAASHDGIASTQASIKGLKRPSSIKAQAPLAIVADVDVIRKAPYRLTASGCGDVVAKLTAVQDWKLAHEERGEYYGEYAASLALMSAKLVMRDPSSIREVREEGIRTLLEALISCGVAISIAGSTRPCSGSEHLFSHALDRIAPRPALHGEQCGVGTIMMAYLQGGDWEGVRCFLRAVGAPTTSRELGIEDRYIIEALIYAPKIRPERYTILRDGLSRSEAERLARATGVIR